MAGVAVHPESRPRLEEVPLATVDLERRPFSPGVPGDADALRTSLQAVGLLAPPYLRAQEGGGFQVVAGWRRLMAARGLGWQAVPAFVLPAGASDWTCLLLSLHDNAGRRPLNPWEQAFYAARLCRHLPPEDVARRYLPLLGAAPAPRLLRRLLKVAQLQDPWPPLIAAGRLSLGAAAILGGWPPAARAAAWPYLSVLPFSHRTQEEFLEEVDLVARRRGKAAADLLAEPELAAPLTDPALSPARRAEAVRRRLKDLAFPEFRRAQAAFREGLKALGLAGHPRIRLEPPPVFEGADFRLTLTFTDAVECERLLREVQRLVATEDFRRLTRP